MSSWNYTKPPFARATARLGGRGTRFSSDEKFICVLDHSQAVMCGHCTVHIPKCPDGMKDPSFTAAMPYRIWISPLHTLCHKCAVTISQMGNAATGQMCGQTAQMVVASGPGQERCTQCTLRRNAEPDCWCSECAGYAGQSFSGTKTGRFTPN